MDLFTRSILGRLIETFYRNGLETTKKRVAGPRHAVLPPGRITEASNRPGTPRRNRPGIAGIGNMGSWYLWVPVIGMLAVALAGIAGIFWFVRRVIRR